MPENLTPTVRKVLNHIRSYVIDGTYAIGGLLPSENELAIRLGVSRGSVRRAIEHLLAAGELSRQPNSRPTIARRASNVPSEEQTDVYVWVASTVRDTTTVPFLQGISAELAGTRYRMVVREPSFFVGDVVRADEGRFLQDLSRKPNVAGAIIWRDVWADHAEIVAGLLQSGVPLVFVDSPAPGELQVDHVGSANQLAAKNCVHHLLELGHRRIACLTDSDLPPSISDRIRGFWRAMRQAGFGAQGHEDLAAYLLMPQHEPEDRDLRDPLGGVYAPVLGPSPHYARIAHSLVAQVLSLDPMPTALFVTYDVLAAWVSAILEGHGVSVPNDISIVGFDWRAHWDRKFVDFLDTAQQDFEGFGRHAVSLLMDRFEGNAPPVARQILLDAPLVVRSSTARMSHSRQSSGLVALATG